MEDPVDATIALPAVLNVFDANAPGVADTLNGAPASSTGPTPVVISTDLATGPPAGFTLNPNGDVDVDAGVVPGFYTFDYEICEVANPANCDIATVEITIGGPAIGLLKQSLFNDESGDGFA